MGLTINMDCKIDTPVYSVMWIVDHILKFVSSLKLCGNFRGRGCQWTIDIQLIIFSLRI